MASITLRENVKQRETADGRVQLKSILEKMCGDVDRLRWFRIKTRGNEDNDAVCVFLYLPICPTF
jgi:hypothetical protein